MSVAAPETDEEKRIAEGISAGYDAGVADERERCCTIVANLRRLLSQQYTDPDPKYNTIEKAREFAAMMSEIALDAIRDGHVSTCQR